MYDIQAKGRIFFCTERKFPHGDAGGKRVYSMAFALVHAGRDVTVISIGKNNPDDYCPEEHCFRCDGIRYSNIDNSSEDNRNRTYIAAETLRLLKMFQLTSNDCVVIYSDNFPYVQAVKQYVHDENGAKTVFDVVEWHKAFQYRGGILHPDYRSFVRCFYRSYASTGNVIAISKKILDFYKKKNINTMYLPIYIVPGNHYRYERYDDGKLHLIYPGNPYRKDSLKTMLKALESMSKEEKRRICFHLTGTRRDLLDRAAEEVKDLLNRPYVMIHKYMSYEELNDLYAHMDFALLARPVNLVTQSNFPSKIPELMNLGIPVMTNRVGDVCDCLTQDHDAFILEKNDFKLYAQKIRECLKMSKGEIEVMHRNAFSTAHKKFDCRLCAEELSEFLS